MTDPHKCDICKSEHQPVPAPADNGWESRPPMHMPVSEDLYFDFKGWRFRAPFHCMCCGKKICYVQWAFGRYCGTCDTGICRTKHLHPFSDAIFCGPNTEIVDLVEAERFRFTADRMTKIPPAKPMEWYPAKPLFPIGDSLAAQDESEEAKNFYIAGDDQKS